MTCPKDCIQDRTKLRADVNTLWKMAIAPWVRSMIICAIITLFGMVASMYLYGAARYATQEDLAKTEHYQETTRKELREELRHIRNKLDKLLERP